jgi:DNA primase
MMQKRIHSGLNYTSANNMEDEIKELFEKYHIHVASESGDELNVYCPFHKNMNSAALFINKRTGLWQCFNPSCGKKGNFRQIYRHVTGKAYGKDTRIDPASLANEIQKGFRGTVVIEELDIDSILIDYDKDIELLKPFIDRGLTQDTLMDFEIGYSKVKDRIVIPVRNANYKLVGFIGRATNPEQEPRYLYNKGFKRADVLFNVQNAKLHEWCIVTEGSVDAMMVHQAGYPNVVSTLGAQVSSTQIKLLKRFFNEIVIMSDNDDAGNAMSTAIIESCRGKKITKADIPEGLKDPGEMTKEQIIQTVENRQTRI